MCSAIKLCRMTMEAVTKPVLGMDDGISHALWHRKDELWRLTERVIDDTSHSALCLQDLDVLV
jgi:hypothetical protein